MLTGGFGVSAIAVSVSAGLGRTRRVAASRTTSNDTSDGPVDAIGSATVRDGDAR